MGTGYHIRHSFASVVEVTGTSLPFPAKLHLKAKHSDLGEDTNDHAIRDHDESLERAGLA
jgi:hypothetical protein